MVFRRTSMTKKAVILLHGVGSNGHDLQPLAQFWQQQHPDMMFIATNAPLPFDQGNGGYQWFSVAGVTEQSRAARIVAARADFDRTINDLLAQHDINLQTDKLMLAGFSQGAIMALDALVTQRFPLAGVVSFSGRLASPEPFMTQAGAKVMLIHGKDDAVIPWTETEKAAAKLEAAGFGVQSNYEAGTGHTITSAGANRASVFIGNTLDQASKPQP